MNEFLFIKIFSLLILLIQNGYANWFFKEDECSVTRNCVIGKWSQWSLCSAPCGTKGVAKRVRRIIQESSCGGYPCERDNEESKPCNIDCGNGVYVNQTCSCNKGWTGNCCEKGVLEKQKFFLTVLIILNLSLLKMLTSAWIILVRKSVSTLLGHICVNVTRDTKN